MTAAADARVTLRERNLDRVGERLGDVARWSSGRPWACALPWNEREACRRDEVRVLESDGRRGRSAEEEEGEVEGRVPKEDEVGSEGDVRAEGDEGGACRDLRQGRRAGQEVGEGGSSRSGQQRPRDGAHGLDRDAPLRFQRWTRACGP